MLKFVINRLEFSSGDSIDLESNSLIVLIGPNSSGKSTALRDIQSQLFGQNNQQVITKCNHIKEGSEVEFRNWLDKNYLTEYY